MTLKLSYLRLIFLTKKLRKRWRGKNKTSFHANCIKNNIKSAHFPSKYGKCADFMQLALCFKFNMVLWRIAKRRSLFGRGKFYVCKFGDSAWPIIITNGNFIEIWELLTKLLISPITDFNLFLFHHLSL